MWFHEWLRMNNAFILCDLFESFRKIMQQTEKEPLNSVKVVMFDARIVIMGRTNGSIDIHASFCGGKYKFHH